MANPKPLLSVVVLCRDNPDQLSDTLAALLQAGPWHLAMGWSEVIDIELLLVDGSSNGTAAQMFEAWQQPPGWRRRRLLLPPRGVYHAMNQSLKAVLGEAIVFMNAGDVYVPGGLHILLRHWLSLAGFISRPRNFPEQVWW